MPASLSALPVAPRGRSVSAADRALLENWIRASRLAMLRAQRTTRHVVRQRELVAELERDGHDTIQATDLLARFEELLQLHVGDRDRLRRELGLVTQIL